MWSGSLIVAAGMVANAGNGYMPLPMANRKLQNLYFLSAAMRESIYLTDVTMMSVIWLLEIVQQHRAKSAGVGLQYVILSCTSKHLLKQAVQYATQQQH